MHNMRLIRSIYCKYFLPFYGYAVVFVTTLELLECSMVNQFRKKENNIGFELKQQGRRVGGLKDYCVIWDKSLT